MRSTPHLLTNGLMLLAFAGCAREAPVAKPESAPTPAPVAKKEAKPQRMYYGEIPDSGAAELTLVVNMH